MSDEKRIDLFNWFEQFTANYKSWDHIKHCPFPFFKIRHHHERTFIADLQDNFEFVAWLFQNHCPSTFALVLQDDDRKGELEPRVYSIRGTGPISGYITGVLFNDDLLMMEFKLRFFDIIQA